MILVLVLVGSDVTERLIRFAPERLQGRLYNLLRVRAPAALGKAFRPGESGES
jgi:hypothetical protein